jgi:hypothetical protein
MKFLIMQFSPVSRHFLPLRSTGPPQHPVLTYAHFNVRGQVPHPYKLAGEVTYTFVYSNLRLFFIWDRVRQKVMNSIGASIRRI